MAFGRFNQRETVFTGYEQARPVAHEGMETRLNFLKKVYSLFFASILFACGGAYLGMTTLAPAIARNYFLFSILEIGLIFFAMAVRQREGMNLLALFAFTSLSGALPGPWLAHLAATQPGVVGPPDLYPHGGGFRRVDRLRLRRPEGFQLHGGISLRGALGPHHRRDSEYLHRLFRHAFRHVGLRGLALRGIHPLRHVQYRPPVS